MQIMQISGDLEPAATAGFAGAIAGGLLGSVYHRFSGLPAARVVPAYAIWKAAEWALNELVNSLLMKSGFGPPVRFMADKSITILSGIAGIKLLRNYGLMDDYMAIIVSIYYIWLIFR